MIKNPMDPGNPIYDMAFNLYAMEEEGLLMTHRGCLNNLCYLLTHLNIDPQDPNELANVLEKANIDWDLTADELDYIWEKTGIQIF